MSIIQFCIARPVAVSVGVLYIVLFGVLALFNIPVQLTPNVDIPVIKVETRWTGATPQEVEREVVERQEEQLRSVQGLREMRSSSFDNRAEIELEFYNDVNKDTALRDVTDKLRQVSGYPLEVEQPTVVATDAAADSPIAWLVLYTRDGSDVDTPKLRDFAEDYIKPYLDRVPGVGSTDVFGGREREIEIFVDSGALATRGLTFQQLDAALRQQNINRSAGTMAQGKLDYSVRTVGQYEDLDQILNTVVAYTPGGPVYVRDVAQVQSGFKKQLGFVRNKGQYVLAFPVRREVGANVIEVMRGLRSAIERVNTDVLQARGLSMELVQVYDETVYIDQAIAMVRNNIVVGGLLAIGVLLLFLRNWRATAVVAIAIPVSVIGTFLLVASFGRTMNVIMLAGMAFAVGMVVDNAIVVLENIYRHFQMGKRAIEAAYEGTREVWGAVVASTLTTIAVFVPVIFVREEAGQLFLDISIATVAAVGLSLVISLTVIPTLATRLLAIGRRPTAAALPTDAQRSAVSGGVSRTAAWVGARIGGLQGRPIWRGLVVGVMVMLCVVLVPFFVPPTSYLPQGNRNLIFGFMITPPGYSVDEFRRMALMVEDRIHRYWEVAPGSPEKAELDREWRAEVEARVAGQPLPSLWQGLGAYLQARRDRNEQLTPPPLIQNFFFVVRGTGCFMGAASQDDAVVRPLANLLRSAGARIPGVIPIFNQASIFRIAGGNNVQIQVRGDDLDRVREAASALQMELLNELKVFPRATPANFDLGRPELQIFPDRERAADVGLNARDVGFILSACVEGAYVGDYRFAGGDTVDIRLKVQGQIDRPTQALRDVPIATPLAGIVPLGSVVRLVDTTALETIYRVERQRAVTLEVTPPESLALEEVLTKIRDGILPKLRETKRIHPSVIVQFTGNADKLQTARETMVGAWTGPNLKTLLNIVSSRFFLSLLIVYLLMAALYESWVYPFVIMFSVPLAILGGFLGLSLAHWGTLLTTSQPVQQLDVVTFLGFVILVGIVVNNAILLVDQALQNWRLHGMAQRDAIRAAVSARLRPIFMTSLTTIAGQLPLALWPGAGSELYRGLASVMVVGLLVSSIGTLVLVPSVLGIVFDTQGWLARLWHGGAAPAPATTTREP